MLETSRVEYTKHPRFFLSYPFSIGCHDWLHRVGANPCSWLVPDAVLRGNDQSFLLSILNDAQKCSHSWQVLQFVSEERKGKGSRC